VPRNFYHRMTKSFETRKSEATLTFYHVHFFDNFEERERERDESVRHRIVRLNRAEIISVLSAMSVV